MADSWRGLGKRRLAIQVDLTLCGVLLMAMLWMQAPPWAITLLLYVASRPSRLEVWPTISDAIKAAKEEDDPGP